MRQVDLFMLALLALVTQHIFFSSLKILSHGSSTFSVDELGFSERHFSVDRSNCNWASRAAFSRILAVSFISDTFF